MYKLMKTVYSDSIVSVFNSESGASIPFDPARLAEQFARPAHLAHLRAGNKDFSDWASLFAGTPLQWQPGQKREEAPLTDVFPRDEFYINNPSNDTGYYVRSRNISGQRRAAAN
jgi:hypothetical protein